MQRTAVFFSQLCKMLKTNSPPKKKVNPKKVVCNIMVAEHFSYQNKQKSQRQITILET